MERNQGRERRREDRNKEKKSCRMKGRVKER